MSEIDQSRPALPQEILDELMVTDPPRISPSDRPISRHLRDALRSRGLNRRDLCMMINWNSKNHTKAYRHIDAALNGTEICEAFVLRAFEVLGFTRPEISKIMAEDQDFGNESWESRLRKRYYNAYRRFGPHLYPMAEVDWRPSMMAFSGDWHFYTRVPFSNENDKFEVPTIAEISQAIAEPASWFRPKPKECFGAYLYHRLPNEMAFFDMDGKLLSQGDLSIYYPSGVKRFS